MGTYQRARCLFSNPDVVLASALLLRALDDDPAGDGRCAECRKRHNDATVGELHTRLGNLRRALSDIKALLQPAVPEGG